MKTSHRGLFEGEFRLDGDTEEWTRQGHHGALKAEDEREGTACSWNLSPLHVPLVGFLRSKDTGGHPASCFLGPAQLARAGKKKVKIKINIHQYRDGFLLNATSKAVLSTG